MSESDKISKNIGTLTESDKRRLIYGFDGLDRYVKTQEWKGIYRQTSEMLLCLSEIGNNLEKYKKIDYKALTIATDFNGSKWYFLQYLLNNSAFNEEMLQKEAAKLKNITEDTLKKDSEAGLKPLIEGLDTDIICFINLGSNSSLFKLISYENFKEESEKNPIRVACYVPIINPEYLLSRNLCMLSDFFGKYNYELSIFFQAIILKLRDMDAMHNLLGNNEIFCLIGDFDSAKGDSHLPHFIDKERQKQIFFDPISNFMKLNWKDLFDICYYFEQDEQKYLASHTFLSPAIILAILERTFTFGIFTQEEKDKFEKKFFKIKNPESKTGDLILNYKNLNVNLKKFIKTLLEKLENEKDPIKIQHIKNLILAPFSTRNKKIDKKNDTIIFQNDLLGIKTGEIKERLSFFSESDIFYILGHTSTPCNNNILSSATRLFIIDHSSSKNCYMGEPLAMPCGIPYITSIPLLQFKTNPKEPIITTTNKDTEAKMSFYTYDFCDFIELDRNEIVDEIKQTFMVDEIKQTFFKPKITRYIIMDGEKSNKFNFIGIYNRNGREHRLYLDDKNQLFIGAKCLEDFIQDKAAPIFQKDGIPVGYYDGKKVYTCNGEDYNEDFEHTDLYILDMPLPRSYMLIKDQTRLPKNIIDMGYYSFNDESHHYYCNTETHQILVEFNPEKTTIELLPWSGEIYDCHGSWLGKYEGGTTLKDKKDEITTLESIIQAASNGQEFDEVFLTTPPSESSETDDDADDEIVLEEKERKKEEEKKDKGCCCIIA